MAPPSEMVARRAQAAAARVQRAHERRLLRELIQLRRELRGDVDALARHVIGEMRKGTLVSPSWLAASSEVNVHKDSIAAHYRAFGHRVHPVVAQAQAEAAIAGRNDTLRMIQDALPVDADLGPVTNPTGQLAAQMGNTAAGSTLADHFAQDVGDDGWQRIRRGLLEGVAHERNPRETARRIRSGLNGNYARALTVARTETLRVYRETGHDLIKAGARNGLLRGWVWYAGLDDRTCPACIAMHGEKMPPDASLDSHPNCRCTMVPDVAIRPGEEDILGGLNPDIQTGPDWFDSIGALRQRRILGKEAFVAYRGGEVQLQDFIQHTVSRKWGPGRRAAGLKRAKGNALKRKMAEQRALRQTAPDAAPTGDGVTSVIRWRGEGVTNRKLAKDIGGHVEQALTDLDDVVKVKNVRRGIDILLEAHPKRGGALHWARASDGGMSPLRITISRSGSFYRGVGPGTARISTYHEVGHYLDLAVMGGSRTRWASAYSPNGGPFDRFIEVTRGLPEFARLRRNPSRKYREYVTSREETWARAFSQYMGERKAPRELAETMRSPGFDSGEFWGPDSWPAVRAEVEAILRSEGLLR